MTTYTCSESHIIYKNETNATQQVRVTVTDGCGGHSQLLVIDINGDPVHDALFNSPGGVATMSVGPSEKIQLFCDGSDTSQSKCSVQLAFP